ncbi:MAG: SnoaL-like domain-containing protein [Phycisphaerales bacterium JB037]
MKTLDVGRRLVELCRRGENRRAIEELYADDAVSVEPMEDPTGTFPRESVGKETILKGADWWTENHEVHDGRVDGPYPFEDRFVVFMTVDVTAKGGPMAGQRMKLEEACHYTVKDGKIARAEFFWDASGCQ